MVMKKQLSKSESMYRKKLIAEYHLDRQWQLSMDYWAFGAKYFFCKTPYKKIYFQCKDIEILSEDKVKQKYIDDIVGTGHLFAECFAAIKFIYKNKTKEWDKQGMKLLNINNNSFPTNGGKNG